jgi:hypothetical protein
MSNSNNNNNTTPRPLSPFVPGERWYKANTPYDYLKLPTKQRLSNEHVHFKFQLGVKVLL